MATVSKFYSVNEFGQNAKNIRFGKDKNGYLYFVATLVNGQSKADEDVSIFQSKAMREKLGIKTPEDFSVNKANISFGFIGFATKKDVEDELRQNPSTTVKIGTPRFCMFCTKLEAADDLFC